MKRNKVNIWNMRGDIIKQFDTLDEAEEWIEDEDAEEIARTHNDGDINISVIIDWSS